MSGDLPAAVRAFDASARQFDQRFGQCSSVAAQRRAVREYLIRAFPSGARLLELGGGTGEDALYLLERGYRVLLTDGSPSMVARAAAKIRQAGYGYEASFQPLLLEELGAFAEERRHGDCFDGAYSNFAAFNCVADLRPLAEPLAALLRPGAPCILVLFGPCCPGELLVQVLRRDFPAALRRLRRDAVPARLGGFDFTVWYRAPRTVARALAPHFRLRRVRGIGIFVPPSAAEPWISRHPRLLSVLEELDRIASAPLALLGDHLLMHFERAGCDTG